MKSKSSASRKRRASAGPTPAAIAAYGSQSMRTLPRSKTTPRGDAFTRAILLDRVGGRPRGPSVPLPDAVLETSGRRAAGHRARSAADGDARRDAELDPGKRRRCHTGEEPGRRRADTSAEMTTSRTEPTPVAWAACGKREVHRVPGG